MRRQARTLETRTVPRCGFFMAVTVNGKIIEGLDGLSIESLLEKLQIKRDFTAVSLNGEVVRRETYDTTIIRDHDKVEIVRPVGGG